MHQFHNKMPIHRHNLVFKLAEAVVTTMSVSYMLQKKKNTSFCNNKANTYIVQNRTLAESVLFFFCQSIYNMR